MQHVLDANPLSNPLAGREEDFEDLILPLAEQCLQPDTIDGTDVQQRAELLIDTSHHPASSGTSKWGVWHVRQAIMANGWSGCTAFQIDGDGFTRVFVA